MWEEVARARRARRRPARRCSTQLDSIQIVYCQTWQYDDAVARLARTARRRPARTVTTRASAARRRSSSSNAHARSDAARRARPRADHERGGAGDATRVQASAGERYPYSFTPAEKRAVPVGVAARSDRGRARGVPGVAHVRGVRQRAPGAPRRRPRRVPRRDRRDARADDRDRGREPARVVPRSSAPRPEIVEPRPDNRMVGYPYTKYMVVGDGRRHGGARSIVATHERADALGDPADRRVYLRGWCYARDPVLVAEHPDLRRSPAMAAASARGAAAARASASTTSRYFDLYSCFASSLHFACDALGHRADRSPRPDGHRRPAVPRRSRRAGTSRTRSRRWSSGCAPTRTRSGW